MSDAFDALRAPVPRIDPDPRFAADLRARLVRAVLQDEGADMTAPQQHSLTPYLAVSDGRRALEWYVEVFGATRRGEPIEMPDGRIGHAELLIGDSVLMLAEEFPDIGHVAPPPDGGGPSIRIEVPDVDASITRAVQLDGTVISAASETGHGYGGTIRDPFGYRWMVSAASAPAGTQQAATRQATTQQPAAQQAMTRHGEAGYFTFEVPDDDAARDFYGAVLGWRFSPGRVERGWNIEGTGLAMAGLHGGQEPGGWRLMYAVDDLPAAIARVRERGGRAGEISRQPYGQTADCVDDQGLPFWLWQA